MSHSKCSLMCYISIFLVLAGGEFGCGGDEAGSAQNTIDIGMLSPLSHEGSKATSVIQFKVAQWAASEINDTGGLDVGGENYHLKMSLKDTGGDRSKGIEAAQEFLQEGIKILIGPAFSGTTIGNPYADPPVNGIAMEVTVPNGMICMSYSATNPHISELDDNDLFWRTVPSDGFQGTIGAQELYDETNYNTAGVIYRKDAWGIGLANSFKQAFEVLGGTITDDNFAGYDVGDGFDASSFDFRPTLDKLFMGNPKVIYLVAFNEISKISVDMEVGNYLDSYTTRPILFGTDGPVLDGIVKNGSWSVIEGMKGTYPSADLGSSNYQKFISGYKEHIQNNDPVGYATLVVTVQPI